MDFGGCKTVFTMLIGALVSEYLVHNIARDFLLTNIYNDGRLL